MSYHLRSKISHLSYKTLFSVLFFVLIGIVILLKITSKPSQHVAAAWFNDSWQYRKAINVTNNTSAQSNVFIQVLLNIGSTLNAQTDDGDLRFTNATGDLLPYYRVSGVGTTVMEINIWLDTFPAGSQTFYGYYGNPSAPDGFSTSDFTPEASSYTVNSFGSQETGGGPLAYWKFDEGGGITAFDSTQNAINGSLGSGSTTPTWVATDQCLNGKCLSFNGTSNYVAGGNSSAVKLTTGTMEAWIKTPNAGSSFRGIVAKQSAYGMFLNSNVFVIYDWGAATTRSSGVNVGDGNWHHLVVSFQSGVANGTILYVDGTPRLTTTMTVSNQNVQLEVGYANAVSQYFTGLIDDVKIYPYVRSSSQILSDYNSRGSIKGSSVNLGNNIDNSEAFSEGLVGYWKMDEGVGTTILDSSGTGYTGTFGAGASAPAFSTGKYGTGTSFVTTDTISIGSTISTIQTVSLWYYASNTAPKFLEFNSTVNIGTSAGTVYAIGLSNPSIFVDGLLSSSIGATNTWHHLTVTTTSPINGNLIYLGRNGANYHAGMLDELRFYSRQLYSNDVNLLANWAPGPVGYWPMDDAGERQVFSYTGGTQVYVVPQNITSLSVKMWGGGGASASYGVLNNGGGGGYSQGIINVSAGNSLAITVGGGANGGTGGYGGGGNGNGGGGGMSKVKNNSTILIAAAGGGGAGPVTTSGQGNGGAGGGINGVDGTDGDANTKGIGGSSSGGAGGTASGCSGNGNSGSSETGGNGVSGTCVSSGGGGGGGYFGGGAGGGCTGSSSCGGGGGGSGYVPTSGYTTAGSGITPGNSSDSERNNAGNGGNAGGSTSDGIAILSPAITDKSGNSNHAQWNGTGSSHRTIGKFGAAANFNGTNDYIYVSDNNALDITSQITVETWVYFKSLPGGIGNKILGKWNETGNQRSYILAELSGSFYFGISTSGTAGDCQVSANTTLVANTWYHLAGVYNRSDCRIYVNGILDSTPVSYTSGIYSGSANLIAGGSGGEPFGGNNNYINGSIDDAKIYNYARSSKQIVQDMNGGHPAGGSPVGSQIGYWKFNEGVGGTTYDSSLQRVNGNLGSGTTTVPTWTNNGQFGKALSFDGGDYVTLGNISSYKIDSKTISFWANPSVAFSGVVAAMSAVSANWYVGFSSSGRMLASYSIAAGSQQATYSPNNTVATNEWHYYTYVWNVSGPNVTVRLYKDGIKNTDTTYTTGYYSTYGSNFLLGSFATTSNFYSGLLDEVKIYNSALSPSEILADYNQGSAIQMGSLSSGTGNTAPSTSGSQEYCVPGDTASCAGPVGEWKFEEGVGATTFDTSGNSKNSSFGAGNSAPVWTNGKNGKALQFNGGQYTTATVTTPTLPFTIQFWTNPASTAPVGMFDSASGVGNVLRNYPAGYVEWWSATPSIPLNLSANTWSLVSLVFRGIGGTRYVDYYKNGMLQIGASGIGTTAFAWTNFTLGNINNGGAGNYSGKLDDFKIYNYQRSSSQIAWDYNKGGPVGHWKLDECQGSTVYDSSGVGTTGTISVGTTGTQTSVGTCSIGGTTAWGAGASGQYNSSINFDGSDDYVNLGAPTALSLTGPVTQSAWIKLATIATQKLIIGAQTQYNFQVSRNSTGDVSVVDGSGHGCYTAANAISSTTSWYHIVGIFSGTTGQTVTTSNCLIYINGVPQTVSIIGTPWSPTTLTSLNIGNINNTAGSTYKVNGQIDDVRIYNYPLTSTQVKTLYNNNSSIQFRQ